MANVFDVLKERGFIEQVSDEGGLRAALEHPVTYYVGYDPSAASLHIGHLMPVMAMAHMQRHGHRPIVLVGGGTGMVGDPTGRTEMRQMLTPERIEENLQGLKRQLSRYLDFGEGKALMVNNADWLLPLNYITFLRDIGRHFSVNRMLAAETYKVRLEAGLSFLEFNYQLLQAYDFLHLYQELDCVLQMGGNDQWGNIVAGVELIRRVLGASAYALTFPLLTTTSGAKMGKTAQGAIWLDGDLLAPYDFYQYWVNVDDADVERFLKLYTFLPMSQIRELGKLTGAATRQAKEVLAFEVTCGTHGPEAAESARDAARSLFGGDGTSAAVPGSVLPAQDLEAGIVLPELLTRVGLAGSRSEARRLIQQGGVYLNGSAVTTLERLVTMGDLADGAIVLRVGKKRYYRVTIA